MTDKPDFDRLGDLLPGAAEADGAAAGPAGRAGDGADRALAGRPAASGGAGLFRKAPRPGAADARPGAARGAGAPGADLDQRLAAVWADVVGAEVAANAKPVQLRDGRLVVTTSSSAWAQTLQMMSEMVVARLNGRLGQGTVEKAVFRHAGWEDFTVAAPSAAPASGAASVLTGAPSGAPSARLRAVSSDDLAGFSEEEKQALASLERLPLSASVKATIRDAMKAGFVRARQDFSR